MVYYVGLCGGLGIGKSALARMLCFELGSTKGYRCRIVAFGDILKAFVSANYNIPLGLLYSEHGKNSLPDWVPSSRPLRGEEVPPVRLWHDKVALYLEKECRVADVWLLDQEIIRGCLSCPVGELTCGRLLQIVGEAFRRHSTQDFWIVQLEKFLASTKTATDMDLVIVEDVRYENEASWITLKNNGVVFKIKGAPPTALCIAKRDLSHPSETDVFKCTAEVDLGTRTGADFSRVAKEIAAIIKL